MRLDWDLAKERLNVRKHGLDFSLAAYVFADPLSVIAYDRYENGEDRFQVVGIVSGRCLLLVYAYPDPEDLEWARVIGLRVATARERRDYEKGDRDR